VRLTASTLHRRGVDALEGGRLTDAEHLLRRALDRADDDDLRALVLASLSYVAAERGRVRDGLELLDGVGQVSALVRARVESQRGLLLMRAGDAGGARDALTQAVRGLDQGDVLARTLLNRSNVHLQLRDLRRARDDCIGCVRVSEAAGLGVLAHRGAWEVRAHHARGVRRVRALGRALAEGGRPGLRQLERRFPKF